MEDNIVKLKPIYSTWVMVDNFIFFQFWKDVYLNVLGNLFMFVPFGFLGWLFPLCNQLKILLIYFLSCIFVLEALQYFTRLGVFDIDDIILNTLGVVIGFYLKNIFDKLFFKNEKA